MTRLESSGDIKLCFIGSNQPIESRLDSLCRRYSCSLIIFREFEDLMKDKNLSKVDILILDRSANGLPNDSFDNWGRAFGSLLPSIIIGSPSIAHWATATLPSTLKQFIVLNGEAERLEAALAKILSSTFKLTEAEDGVP